MFSSWFVGYEPGRQVIKKPGVINDPLVKGGINPNPGLYVKIGTGNVISNNFGKVQIHHAVVPLLHICAGGGIGIYNSDVVKKFNSEFTK